ncbi:MAG: A/G-specific adenine glycosylase [Chloroflexi bacterium]|nr:A/G-specific adenine glycosylase [Chloroflexota bacterium]
MSGLDPTTIAAVQEALLAWYAVHQRALPWREAAGKVEKPYAVVVSELMLHQTRVDRVVPVYRAFVARFPGFAALAAAPMGEVVRAWAGLGYNRRAVYLHQLAQRVVADHNGSLPDDRDALLRLPGIGAYTASAIRSFAFGHDEPALDTNVRRVLGRVFLEGDPSDDEVARIAAATVATGRSSEWNQALMDLGSSLCTARHPRCLLCPIRAWCRSAGAAWPAQSRSQGTFRGSTRYYRGRLLAMLCEEPATYGVRLEELRRQLEARGVPSPQQGWASIVARLARDGLLAVREEGGHEVVALPE